MPLFTSEYLKRKSSVTSLNESVKVFTARNTRNMTFDIFLSHSFLDKQEVFGLYTELTALGYTVYVDWIVDSDLDRSKVTKQTAELIKERLKNSKSLLLAISTNATMSKWMPWELGIVDGNTDRCAIVPISQDNSNLYTFDRVEYLKLYPYLDIATDNSGAMRLWINEDSTTYTQFENWINGHNPTKRS
ncbi:TIR domain-containing protein [Flavobacterium oncorhynchi]|uniref:TIR domain-containing protein n=1 Tax=Flavobacterium oncorhynchi TaxID=728056 RepID=UPI00351A290D